MALDRTTLFLWWGPDAQDNDCVASANGQALTWPAAERAWDSAALNGWPGTETGTLPDQILDLDPALAWLRQTRAQLDPSAGLNLWNIAGDVAYSTGLAWHDRSRLRDSCYDKHVAANIPWLVGQDAYTPRWTAQDLNVLRAVLGRAVHVLRTAIAWEQDRSVEAGTPLDSCTTQLPEGAG